MHGISAHSALAIKRQRRRRDRAMRGKARRGSQQHADHYEGDNKVRKIFFLSQSIFSL